MNVSMTQNEASRSRNASIGYLANRYNFYYILLAPYTTHFLIDYHNPTPCPRFPIPLLMRIIGVKKRPSVTLRSL